MDVAQDVIVREEDCGTPGGFYITAMRDGNEELQSLSERIIGRVAAEDVVHPETGGEILVGGGAKRSVPMRPLLSLPPGSKELRCVPSCNVSPRMESVPSATAVA